MPEDLQQNFDMNNEENEVKQKYSNLVKN